MFDVVVCIADCYTQGDIVEELMENVKEAIELCLELLLK